MEEVWKIVNDYPNYEVSNTGRVRNRKSGRLLQQKLGREGRYMSVYLCNNGHENTQRVHRLVAKAFIPNPENKPQVNHIDGNRLNNHISNLEWCTSKENNLHAIKTELNHPGEYQKKPIRVIETGEIFNGVVECSKAIGADFRNVYQSASSNGHYAVNGYHCEYVNTGKRTSGPLLFDYQLDAVKHMKNGSILCGGVGSGKSLTSLFYYFKENGGWIDENGYVPMKEPKDLYIITTARKRDTKEWEGELVPFLLTTNPEVAYYKNKVVIDSWNNIGKYKDVYGAYFILDEQRLIGSGAWVKAFLNIARKNKWILLSATPGDTWSDYIPVFVANGFYKNKTEFIREHVIYSRFTKYPKIDRFINTGRLIRLRNDILVTMDFKRQTVAHHEDVYCKYDIAKYKDVSKLRWDPYKNEPIINAAGLCYVWRKIVNTDDSRQVALLELFEKHPKMIIFYNFNYELDILKEVFGNVACEVAEWNGHAHQPIPEGRSWVYLVQYTAGAEGWNCITTDTIVFYSQNYSYKVMQQAAGRIDRLNTRFVDLYYYHLKSRSGIDLAISRALSQKRNFNEGKYAGSRFDI